MTVRIGINPITWTNDDVPELGGDTPLEVCLSETRQAGYAGTELGGKFPRRSAELKPIMISISWISVSVGAGNDVALVVQRHGGVLAILVGLATPDTLVVLGQLRHIGETGILDAAFRLVFGEAVCTGKRRSLLGLVTDRDLGRLRT